MTSEKSSNLRKYKSKFIIRREIWLVIIPVIVYILVLIFHFVYTHYINLEYRVIIADQLVFYNRGIGVLQGKLPYKDFYTNAAPLSSYLWGPIVFISMVGSGDFNLDFLGNDNFIESNSMMLSSYIFRIFFVITIILSAILLFRLEERRKNKHAFPIALIYSLNPFFIFLVSFWGSDECIVPLLILLPVYLYERGNKTLATLSIVLGVGLKYFPVFMAPIIWVYSENWKQRIIQTLIFIIGLVAMIIPFYLLDPEKFISLLEDPIQEQGNQGILTIIQSFFNVEINQYSYVFQIFTIIMVCLSGLILYLKRNDWNYRQTAALLLVFLIFYQKMQISYIVMIFPFLFVSFFEKGLIRWMSILLFLTTVFYSEIANYLIGTSQIPLLNQILAWIFIIMFYILLVINTILHILKSKTRMPI